jgi:DNA-directed RNA polymerase specialized sigma24 family protein
MSHWRAPFVEEHVNTDTYHLAPSRRPAHRRNRTTADAAYHGTDGTRQTPFRIARIGKAVPVHAADPVNDQVLLERACLGDIEALNGIVRNHWRCVYRLVSGSALERTSVEELVGEVFARSISRISTLLVDRADLCLGLTTIARDLLQAVAQEQGLSLRTLTRTEPRTTTPVISVLHTDGVLDTPSSLPVDAARVQRVIEMIPLLPVLEQELMRLRLLEGMSVSEVAAWWGRTVEFTARVQQSALDTLRAEMESGEWE